MAVWGSVVEGGHDREMVGGALEGIAVERARPVRGSRDDERAVDIDAGQVETEPGWFEQSAGADDLVEDLVPVGEDLACWG
jgi:hypothetical protein